jgi:hypothetical protein
VFWTAAASGACTAAVRALTPVPIRVAAITTTQSVSFGLFFLFLQAANMLFEGTAASLVGDDGLELVALSNATLYLLVSIIDRDRRFQPLEVRTKIVQGTTLLTFRMLVVIC